MAATSSALAAGLMIAIPVKPIRNAKKTASDLRPLRALIVFNFPLLRHGIVCHQPHLNRPIFSGITGGGYQLMRRAPIGQFGEIIAIFRRSSFGADGAEGTGSRSLGRRNRILLRWRLSGHFPGGHPPCVAALQRRHVEAPVEPADDRFPGAVFLVTQRGFQETLVVVGANAQVQSQLEA